jgi:hypothetical protein
MASDAHDDLVARAGFGKFHDQRVAATDAGGKRFVSGCNDCSGSATRLLRGDHPGRLAPRPRSHQGRSHGDAAGGVRFAPRCRNLAVAAVSLWCQTYELRFECTSIWAASAFICAFISRRGKWGLFFLASFGFFVGLRPVRRRNHFRGSGGLQLVCHNFPLVLPNPCGLSPARRARPLLRFLVRAAPCRHAVLQGDSLPVLRLLAGQGHAGCWVDQ